ncbi:hypothetical protein [Lacticaseibacillus kribbianus]|uniref:hypothetical protein n=1 Tax=Lacticaseibacillus kribbianus TaxID=2926292 RepID=UPI001CD4C51A|nr:hypothetical protein [Lacticaseibacillus kribbianus]
MRALIRLELKKQPWVIHLVALLGMLLLFAAPLGHYLGVLPNQYYIIDGVKHYLSVRKTRANQQAAAVATVKRELKENLKNQRDYPDHDRPAAIKMLRAVQSPLARGDYRTVNRVTLAAITKDPTIVYNDYAKDFLQSGGENQVNKWERVAYPLKDLVRRNQNRLLAIDQTTTATAIVYNVWADAGSHTSETVSADDASQVTTGAATDLGTPLMWAFLAYVTVALALVFNFDARNHTEPFMRMTPAADLRLAVTRGLLTLVVIFGVMLALIGLALVMNAAVPGQTFGSLGLPLADTFQSHTTIVPIWLYLARALALMMAWAALIAGIVFTISQVSGNALVAMMFSAALILLMPLHVLDGLDVAVRQLFPAYYTNPAALLNHLDYFAGKTLAQVLALFARWTLAAWLIGAIAQWLRAHVRAPWAA